MMRRVIVMVCACALVLACGETEGCPDGESWVVGPDGTTTMGDCLPLDAGTDSGRRDTGRDTNVPDVGPCGTCSAPRARCDETTMMCVECLVEVHCGGEDKCDTTGTCVECLTNADCSDSAMPICGTDGACRACGADTECMDTAATPVCDEDSGRCEECTADTEAAECAGFSCSRLTHTCTTTTLGILDVCDACEADSECAAGRNCIPHVFMGTDLGYFCFYDSSMGGCGDTDTTRRPYSTAVELTSIDDVVGMYCMPPTTTTCQGIRDTRNVTCAVDTDCGVVDEPDGYCPTVGSGAGLCSYLCGGGSDCATPPLECAGGPLHCRPT